MKKVALVGLPIIALIIGGILYGPGLYEAFVTGGEKTLTGGDAYHAPIQYRKKDSREAITEPEFVPAGELLISGGTKGIGVSIDGDSRFYPLYVLQYHQVINDKVGNSAIACSY
jgi:hypothetical protein